MCGSLFWQAGAPVLFVGLKDSSDPTPVYQSCVVTSKEGLYLNRSNPPRFRAFNEDIYNFDRCSGVAKELLLWCSCD
jgi:hypothetical protein